LPRLPSVLRLSAALWLCALAALGADFAALKPQGYVSDFAQVIDPDSRAAIERYCAALEKSTGAELALVTLPSLEGEPVEDVANALFRAWGVGKKGANEGALLLLSIRERRSRLETGYGLEPIITDGDSGSILRAMSPELREGRYGPAMLRGAYEIGERIARAKRVSVTEAPPPPARGRPIGEGLPIGAILMALALLIFLPRLGRAGSPGCTGCLGGFLLGNLMRGGGGWGSSWGSGGSGGGFGGYDSGGGFGGFGGGDSGGGGASGSW
jgi:uncharacterized protein